MSENSTEDLELTREQLPEKEESDTQNNTRTVAGILLVVFGAYLLLDNLNLFDVNIGRIIATWWPLLLVYFGIEQLAKNRPSIRAVWYIILIAVLAYILMSGIFN